MAHTLGYSLIPSAPNYIGKLTQSQLHAIFEGYANHEKKKADSIKRSSKSGPNRVEAGLHNMHMVPGVRTIKKKR